MSNEKIQEASRQEYMVGIAQQCVLWFLFAQFIIQVIVKCKQNPETTANIYSCI